MLRPRWWITAFVFTAVLQAVTAAQALCLEPFDSVLDKGLQRALLADAFEAGVELEDLESDENESIGLADILSPASVGRLFNCGEILDQLIDDNENAPPPSVVSPEFEDLVGLSHARWYLVSVQQGEYRAASSELTSGGSSYGDAAYGFSDLEVFVIHMSTVKQFRELLTGGFEQYLDHLMQDAPMMPAWDSSYAAVGLPSPAFAHQSGSSYSIAIVDTGVDRQFFSAPDVSVDEDLIIEEACFSTTAMLLMPSVPSVQVCPGGTVLASEIDVTIEPDGDHPNLFFGAVAVKGNGTGAPCDLKNDCKHGTKVAYLAAGVQSEQSLGIDAVKDLPSGVAPPASIIAIQVASEAPPVYCIGEKTKGESCVVIYPHDVLRALSYISGLKSSDTTPRLVAVNLSLQVRRLCGKPDEKSGEEADVENGAGPDPEVREEDEPDLCATSEDEVPMWDRSSHDEPCGKSPFATWIDKLKGQGVWTVVAAGNRRSREKVGVVSLPACVKSAITVAASDDGPGFMLSPTSMIARNVDVVAPGVDILTPATADSLTGTSFAAPQVAGILVLLRKRARGCGGGDVPDLTFERDWLKANTTKLEVAQGDLPDFSLGLDLERMVVSLADASFSCD